MKPTKLFLALAVATVAAFGSSAMAEEVTDSIRTYDLDDVTVHATRLLLVTKNDTTIYDLDALTVKEGGLADDGLLHRASLPEGQEPLCGTVGPRSAEREQRLQPRVRCHLAHPYL